MSNAYTDPPGAGVTAKVTAVGLPGRGQDATGQWVSGRTVTYQTANNAYGSVFVPDTQFTPDAVAVMLKADAANLAAIANLTV